MRRLWFVLPLLAAIGFVGGCDDDDSGNRPTMANIWPHADGSSWTYEMSFRAERNAVLTEVGDLPGLEELRRDLETPLDGTPDTTITPLYTLAFEGMTTTSSGVEAQNLVQYVEDVGGTAGRKLAALDGFDPIYNSPRPLLLRGGAFAYEDSGYYLYGSWTTDHTWIYLEDGLEEGQEFSLTVAPEYVDDRLLYGRIYDAGNMNIGGRVYENVVECMYLYDLGEVSVLDESGTEVGTAHSYIYGQIFFAPGVGPVASHERSRIVERTAYNPQGHLPTTYSIQEFECRVDSYHLPYVLTP